MWMRYVVQKRMLKKKYRNKLYLVTPVGNLRYNLLSINVTFIVNRAITTFILMNEYLIDRLCNN